MGQMCFVSGVLMNLPCNKANQRTLCPVVGCPQLVKPVGGSGHRPDVIIDDLCMRRSPAHVLATLTRACNPIANR